MVNEVLPNGWSRCKLRDIVAVNPKKIDAESSLKSGFIPMANAPVNFQGKLKIEEKLWGEIKKSYTNFQDNDVIFAKVTPCFENGKAAIVRGLPNGIGAGSSEFYVLRAHAPLVLEKYVFGLIKSQGFMQEGAVNMTGAVGLRRVPRAFVENYLVSLPPQEEQKVIAEKLDSLLEQVEITKERLDRVPDILKRFRQSVLAAAVSGRLTEEWRGSVRYTPTDFDFDIPESWALKSIHDIAQVKGGKRLPKGEELIEENTGYRYVRAGQLKFGTVISGQQARNKQMYITEEVREKIRRYTISSGDAYLTIVGASIGDAGIVPEEFDGANLTENAAKICEYKIPVSSKFVGYWLRSQCIQDLIQLEVKSGAQGKLALMRIKRLPCPILPIEEQTAIVRRVEELFAYADKIEQQTQVATERVNKLTQSILAKAFRGELTKDWRAANPDLISGENSAEALLEKIKLERKAMTPKKRSRKAKG